MDEYHALASLFILLGGTALSLLAVMCTPGGYFAGICVEGAAMAWAYMEAKDE